MRFPRFRAACLLVALVVITGAAAGADLQPVDLRCEYRREPLGVDVPQPRLSWGLAATAGAGRNLRQTAYHLRVASTGARLAAGQADLWDSGEVGSAETLHIPFAGPPLPARQECHWSVRVRDPQGRWSAWSPAARWTMGLLQPSDWSAQWIGTGETFRRGPGSPPPDNAPPDPWFRRSFTLDAPPRRATAHVASVGFHELWINGRKVGDAVLAPQVTDNSRRARYLAYEIAEYLRPGTNVLGLWLGTGWSIFPKFETADKPRAPIVLAQFDLELPSGERRRLVTDGTWKTHPSPRSLLGVWDFMHFGGERHDAARELPDWCRASLDDATWPQARVFQPALTVSADLVEPNQAIPDGELVAREITEPSPGVYRVDLGRNVAGFFRLGIQGEPGDRIAMQFSEHPDKPMTHRLRNEYLVGPTGEGVFENRFNYGVGRWVTITGLRQPPGPALGAHLVRPAFDRASDFVSSNDQINRIFRVARWTFENLTLGGFLVDCPHRERMGYGGDAHATTTMGLLNYRLGALYTKWAQDWRDTQGRGAAWGAGANATQAVLEEGNLPYTAPTYWGGGGPGWSGFVVHLPWEMWRAHGDRRLVEEMFPTIERWLAFLETRQRDNLLRRWGGEWDFLGDWLWPGAEGVNGDTRETLFFNNCYWIYNLQTAADLATVLGRTERASQWRQRADTVRRAVHAEFFQPAEASYVNGSQAYLAIALVANVPPENLRPAVWKRLEKEILEVRQGHIHAGITGGAFLFKALMEARRDDLLLTMIRQETYPGWGDMLRQGATAFWESWENNPGLSYLHSSFLYVGAWFIERGLGIQPLEPGFAVVSVAPPLVDPETLRWASGHYDSVRGRIGVEWSRAGGRFLLRVGVPPNMTAEMHVPCTVGPEALEGGRAAFERTHGVELLRVEPTRWVVRAGSGEYRFHLPVAEGTTEGPAAAP